MDFERPPKDKAKVKRRMAAFFRKTKPQTVQKLTPDLIVICTHAKDFDPRDNRYWDLYANKSAVRDDVFCAGCGGQMATSHWVYGQWKAMVEKPKIYCIACGAKVAEEEKRKEDEAKLAAETPPAADPGEPNE